MPLSNHQEPSSSLIFLKLGGSLITDKNTPHTPRLDVIKRLAEEIANAIHQVSGFRLILGHGSGSFGHIPARRYGTHLGVHTPGEWAGFIEVWREAAALNHLVIEAFNQAKLPALPFPPSASVMATDGKLSSWDLTPLRRALRAGLLPVVYGDVVFDVVRGGTILSTEDLFAHLAVHFRPNRLLLAGLESGVWEDYPQCTKIIEHITPLNLPEIAPFLGGSAATDVTGGMASKVQKNLELVEEIPELEVRIFSGEVPGAVESALRGGTIGTLIHSNS